MVKLTYKLSITRQCDKTIPSVYAGAVIAEEDVDTGGSGYSRTTSQGKCYLDGALVDGIKGPREESVPDGDMMYKGTLPINM